MKARYLALGLFLLAPTLAFAQTPDVNVFVDDDTYPAVLALFGPRLCPDPLGPPPNVDITVFDNGFTGHDPSFSFGEGFPFNGTDGIFVSTVLVGGLAEGDTTVNANPYIGFSEFTPEAPIVPLSPPFEPPFEDFDFGVQAVFSSPLGVTITERAYDLDGEGLVVFDLAVENTMAASLDGLYLGVFADLDVGTTLLDDAGGFNEALKLAYVYDPVMDLPYFGITALDVEALSGHSLDATTADDAQLFSALTTASVPAPEPAERAAVVGVGPYDLAPGQVQPFRFAFVAGEDEAALFENAARAQSVFPVAAEAGTPAGAVVLESAFPNPLAAQATIGFALPTPQRVTLKVYDGLGREVVVLVDGVRPAGEQSVMFDASDLPSGVYLVRLDTGEARLTQRLTVVQ